MSLEVNYQVFLSPPWIAPGAPAPYQYPGVVSDLEDSSASCEARLDLVSTSHYLITTEYKGVSGQQRLSRDRDGEAPLEVECNSRRAED
jgi:hypothetical protein